MSLTVCFLFGWTLASSNKPKKKVNKVSRFECEGYCSSVANSGQGFELEAAIEKCNHLVLNFLLKISKYFTFISVQLEIKSLNQGFLFSWQLRFFSVNGGKLNSNFKLSSKQIWLKFKWCKDITNDPELLNVSSQQFTEARLFSILPSTSPARCLRKGLRV